MTVMMKLTITKSERLDWALHQFFKQHWGFWFVCGTDGFSTSFGLNKLLNKMMIHLQSATHAVIEQQSHDDDFKFSVSHLTISLSLST